MRIAPRWASVSTRGGHPAAGHIDRRETTMGYKTILVHMDDDTDHSGRLAFAVSMARRYDAHLDILHVLSPAVPMVPGRGASAAFVVETLDAERDRAARIAREVRALCSDVRYGYHALTGDPVERLAERSVLADLAIVSQASVASYESHWSAQPADRLPDGAACPVLVLPAGTVGDAVGRHPLVGWTPARPSARAVHGALPMLKTADAVTVLCGAREGHETADMEAVSVFLGRHGVEATVHPSPFGTGEAGPVLLDAARRHGCDCLVIGAYGHSRWREILFGGTTRHVLTHATVPVLISR
jgi:nucleotide-binding universal stress UspA family protein